MITKEEANAADITDKRERIINSAGDLIVENGIQLTTTALIAERAQVANGTLYLYFESKRDLVYAVYQRLVEDITEILLAEYSSEAPVQERFFRYWSVFLEHLLQHPKRAKLLLYLNATPYIDSAFKREVSGRLLHVQADMLREGKYFVKVKAKIYVYFISIVLMILRCRGTLAPCPSTFWNPGKWFPD